MRRSGWRVSVGLCALVIALAAFGAGQAAEIAPGFRTTWERIDRPVQDGTARRTWMWGPGAYSDLLSEPYVGSPGGERLVQYFDKSRMEITDPDADPRDPWYVTNGLLASELITGRMQLGDDEFEHREPAKVQVAGDPHPDSPTYATFGDLLERQSQPPGQVITETIDGDGLVGTALSYTTYGITAAYHVEETGQAVASVFWEFMNRTGPVYIDGSPSTDRIFPNPFYGIGLPISGAYWTRVPVDGVPRDVLVQCFERRCLTYNPDNPEGWKVEAGNVGQHYYEWRYSDPPVGNDPGAPAPGECTNGEQAVLETVSDSLGNVNPNSWARGTGGDWPGGNSSIPAVEVGQEVTVQISAAGGCPPLEYRAQRFISGSGVDVVRDWSTEPGFSYRFSQGEAGKQVMFIVDLRDGGPRTRFQQRDDYTYLIYRVESQQGE